MAAKNCAGLGQPAMMTFRTGKGKAAVLYLYAYLMYDQIPATLMAIAGNY